MRGPRFKKPLHNALTDYLDERNFPIRDVQTGDPKTFTAAWHIDEVEQALTDFDLNAIEDDDVTNADVRMMFCWLTDIAALPDEEMNAIYENVRQEPDFAARRGVHGSRSSSPYRTTPRPGNTSPLYWTTSSSSASTRNPYTPPPANAHEKP